MVDPCRGTPAALVALGLILASPGGFAQERDAATLIQFGAEMAEKGNWREARFRWEEAIALRPNDPGLLNNLAVSAEALGDGARAGELYERALGIAQGDRRIEENYERFRRHQAQVSAEASRGSASPAPRAEEEGPGRKGSKARKVAVSLPVPPKIDLAGARTLLVASFLTPDSGSLLDANREVVRFLRGEFRKHTKLDVQDVSPPPAVPEQTIEEMALNAEFWRRLGKEFGADLIVSGQVSFTRNDASGYQDVDVISQITGQKVRQSRFVEAERFAFETDILYFDGATGALRFRDRLRRSAVFPGLGNDPITALYGLAETVAGDLLAAVSSRTREEPRFVFRK